MPFSTITEIRNANKAAGGAWFDQPCRAETAIIDGHYWVESRAKAHHEGDGRWYAAVHVTDDGRVKYLDHDQTRLDSVDAARQTIEEHRNG
ncbi:hypothetical protein [Gordonia malaquae]|uniref:hypothetical protein n=1 Tax=Gordonia malaquae TaxID=410332 RepID=UPI0030169523